MSEKKRKDPKAAEPIDPHLREAHLAEGVERHAPPAFAPVSVNPMLGQPIAPVPMLPPETPSAHQTAKTSGQKPTRTKSEVP